MRRSPSALLHLRAFSSRPVFNKLYVSPSTLLKANVGGFSRPVRWHGETWLVRGVTRIDTRQFHVSHPRKAIPPIWLLLKSSAALELAGHITRIVLSLAPISFIKVSFYKKFIRRAHDLPGYEEKKKILTRRIRLWKNTMHTLLFIPTAMIIAAVLASFERTPLTGRWRLIFLSPEEETEMADQLAGGGWYGAVETLLNEEGTSTQFVGTDDWRVGWILDTLRHLEASLSIFQLEPPDDPTEWYTELDASSSDRPVPPPSRYVLKPRPRMSSILHAYCESWSGREMPSLDERLAGIGPPYSLLVVERPDKSNAFSFGFGPDGGGGIVVYSGFLDEILKPRYGGSEPLPEPVVPQSFLSSIFGTPRSQSSHHTHRKPTVQQTEDLAVLLAHELAHLVLCHHLESLSGSAVFIPQFTSIILDLFRTVLFPFTMLFGPFVNDAIGSMGKTSSVEWAKKCHVCTSMKQEIEADIVAASILAHAGFDARNTVRFWEERVNSPTPSAMDCSMAQTVDENRVGAHGIMGTVTHPLSKDRVDHLRKELARWEAKRQSALAQIRKSLEQNA